MHSFLKTFSVMANSADPDQPEQSDLDLHCLHTPFCQKLAYEILGHLPYTRVQNSASSGVLTWDVVA